MKDDPITALSLAVANVNAEREKLRQLVRDYHDYLLWLYNDVKFNDASTLRPNIVELDQRANELLGE